MAVTYSVLEESCGAVACLHDWHCLLDGAEYCIIDSRFHHLPKDA